MANSISVNPMLTTTNYGGFSTQSYGFVQGVAMDDPAVRFALAGGVLATTETLPMWGGVGVYANVPALYGSSTSVGSELGPIVGRATTQTAGASGQLIGFSVFNQATAWISTPQSPVPTASANMTVPYFPLGSGARIAVACDPSLAASVVGGSLSQPVSWDFNNQVLQAYDASTPSYSLTSITSSYSATTGLYTFVVVAAAATPVGAVGDSIYVAGVTSTGAAYVNGTQTVSAFTNNQNFSFQVAAPSGAIATGALSGTLTLTYGTAALPCKILRVQSGGSKTVVYNAVTGVATWNNSGTAALIQI
jgi:hypothetical protein